MCRGDRTGDWVEALRWSNDKLLGLREFQAQGIRSLVAVPTEAVDAELSVKNQIGQSTEIQVVWKEGNA
jgi:hypothetical protein